MKIAWIFALSILVANAALAQQNSRSENKAFARNPLWVQMIDDTTTNYFVAEEAFNTYFKHHELPEGENEEIGEHAKQEKISKRKQRRIWKENALRMDVKRYNIWHQQMQPYVQSDGRILYTRERLAIWKEQQKGR
ncbi:MAG: hypothetical protein ABI378_15205 [Chitinophagaceae bacterium]